jgi:hypothetical protein
MLNQFNSNTKKQPKIINPINKNSINETDLTGSLLNIDIPTKITYQNNTKQNPFKEEIVNKNSINEIDLTGSLLNIDIPTKTYYEPQTKINTNTSTIVNNKSVINAFHTQILQYGARYIKKEITGFNSGSNQFYVSASVLDYGTEEPSPENFEIMVDGLHIPGIYKVEQSGSNVVVTILQNGFVDWDLIDNNQRVIVYGKFLN